MHDLENYRLFAPPSLRSCPSWTFRDTAYRSKRNLAFPMIARGRQGLGGYRTPTCPFRVVQLLHGDLRHTVMVHRASVERVDFGRHPGPEEPPYVVESAAIQAHDYVFPVGFRYPWMRVPSVARWVLRNKKGQQYYHLRMAFDSVTRTAFVDRPYDECALMLAVEFWEEDNGYRR